MTLDLRRSEMRFLTGQGRYLQINPSRAQRTPYFSDRRLPHGRIVRCDTDGAKNMPGVIDIITADDVTRAGLAPCPASPMLRRMRGGRFLAAASPAGDRAGPPCR